jgi:DNA-binding GntR family transcriptional regulator
VTSITRISSLDGHADQKLELLHSTLRHSILSGQLAPGTIISQVKLAESLNVGRTPLREALRMLQREGLVQAEFNRRVRVAPISTSELEQIYAHRVVLEVVALRATVTRFRADDITQLWSLIEEMNRYLPDPAPHRDAWERAHREFHARLVAGAGEHIADDLRRLQDHAERYRAILGRGLPAVIAAGAQDHADIIAACESGDEVTAGRVLGDHLARAGLALISHSDPAHDGQVLRQALLLTRGAAPSSV